MNISAISPADFALAYFAFAASIYFLILAILSYPYIA